MTSDEKIEALVKQVHEVTKEMQDMSVSHQKVQDQNEYLKKQLGNPMKQKQKLQQCSFWSKPNYGGQEEASNALDYSNEEVGGIHDPLLQTPMISKLNC